MAWEEELAVLEEELKAGRISTDQYEARREQLASSAVTPSSSRAHAPESDTSATDGGSGAAPETPAGAAGTPEHSPGADAAGQQLREHLGAPAARANTAGSDADGAEVGDRPEDRAVEHSAGAPASGAGGYGPAHIDPEATQVFSAPTAPDTTTPGATPPGTTPPGTTAPGPRAPDGMLVADGHPGAATTRFAAVTKSAGTETIPRETTETGAAGGAAGAPSSAPAPARSAERADESSASPTADPEAAGPTADPEAGKPARTTLLIATCVVVLAALGLGVFGTGAFGLWDAEDTAGETGPALQEPAETPESPATLPLAELPGSPSEADVETFDDVRGLGYLTDDELSAYAAAGASEARIQLHDLPSESTAIVLLVDTGGAEQASAAAEELRNLQLIGGAEQAGDAGEDVPPGVHVTEFADSDPEQVRAHYASAGIIARVEVLSTIDRDTALTDFRSALEAQLELLPVNT